MPEGSTPINVLHKLAGVPPTTSLVALQAGIETALATLKDQTIPMTSAVLLCRGESRRLLFFSSFSVATTTGNLALGFLPLLGEENGQGSNRDAIDVASALGAPLYLKRRGIPVSQGRFQRLDFESVAVPAYLANPDVAPDSVSLSIPAPPDEGSDAIRPAPYGFFDHVVVSALPVPWPFSTAGDRLLVATIFSLTQRMPTAENSSLEPLLAEAVPLCSIGPVIAQLFLEYALLRTSLPQPDVLIEDMLIGGWLRAISDEVSLPSKFLRSIIALKSRHPFAHRILLRALLFSPSAEGQYSLLQSEVAQSLTCLILPNDLPRSLAEQLKPAALLTISAPGSTGTPSERLQRLAAVWTSATPTIASLKAEVLPVIKNLGAYDHDARVESIGQLIWALRILRGQPDSETSCLHALAEHIGAIPEDTRDLFGHLSMTLLAQSGVDLSTLLSQAPRWALSRDAGDLLAEQLGDLKTRLDLREKAGSETVVAVLSQKGGVGKSTLALAMAAYLARRGERTCLVELDFAGPTLAAYPELRKAPFLNELWDRLERSPVSPVEFGGTERKMYRNPILPSLAIMAASPMWADQLRTTRSIAGFPIGQGVEEIRLNALLDLLKPFFDAIVLDCPAEIKELTRAMPRVLAGRNGLAAFVATPFQMSIGPLVEHHLRLTAMPDMRAALIINRTRPVEEYSFGSADALQAYYATREHAPLRAFGLDLRSPSILRLLFGEGTMNVGHIPLSEEVERASRQDNLSVFLSVLDRHCSGALAACPLTPGNGRS